MTDSEGAAVFFKKVRATLEYGLHRANVLSGELAEPRRRPKVQQKKEYKNQQLKRTAKQIVRA